MHWEETVMNRRAIIALSTAAVLFSATSGLCQAAEQRADADVATEYESEARQLREKAQAHSKMAKLYRARTPPKGSGSYQSIAKHCDKLAQYYEDAAKEAEAVAAELSK